MSPLLRKQAGRMRIRHAEIDDAEELACLLNDIIAEGGKTAIDTPLTDSEIAEWFIIGPHCISCLIAVTDDVVLGFQTLERFHGDLPPGVADIATFVAEHGRSSGIGRRLANATAAIAEEVGLECLRAVIQASNEDAIGYYRSIGFHGDADSTTSELVTLTRCVAPARDA